MTNRLSTEKAMSVMNEPEKIRNISVIAHVDHGKTTLTDSLVHSAGLMKDESVGNRRFTDTMKQEMERGVTIKSTSITLIHEATDGKEYLVNVIDSPGHIDFSSEVTAALRCTDGGIIVIDVVEGVASQTNTVMKQALQERVIPCLMINKIDRMITELGATPEELYLKFEELVAQVNRLLEKFKVPELGQVTVHPVLGNVCFGSGKDGFAFTISSFVDVLAGLIPNLNKEYFRKRMWGNYYYDPANDAILKDKKKSPITGKTLERTFVKFILKPLYDIYGLFNKDFDDLKKKKKNISKIKKFNKRYNIKLSHEELERISNEPKKVRNMVLKRLSPAASALLEMIVNCLPSPVKAQVYRAEMLYSGPPDDPICESIRKCDPNGPLVLYITKTVEIRNKRICFGRIFSGSVRNSQKVYVLPDSTEDDENNNSNKRRRKKIRAIPTTIQNAFVMLAKSTLNIPFCVSGMVCGVTGVDSYVLKTATITDHPSPTSVHPIRSMKFSVRPVVQIGIRPKRPSQLKTLLAGVRRMVKTDPILQLRVDQATNQLLLQGSGEFHLALTLEVLRDEVCKNVEIVTSPMIVTFRETVTDSSEECLSKSKNRLNRVFVSVEPLPQDLISDLRDGKITNDPKLLREKYGWSKDEIKKIWAFGPAPENTCVLVNCSRGVMYLNEVKDSLISGFQYVCQESVLSKEPLRGVRVNILDGMFHSDNSHRGTGQILPCMRRAIFGALLNAKPSLVEPWYNIEVQTSQNSSGTVYSVLKKRRGIITNIVNSDTLVDGVVIHAFLPVLESFGLVKELRTETSGDALTSMQFDHYEPLPGDVLFDQHCKSFGLVMDIRKRKNMKMELPEEKDYRDKL